MKHTQEIVVLNSLIRDGGITHLKAQHYNIGCIRKVISSLRSRTIDIVTVRKTDLNGQKYTEWKLAELDEFE